jgi:predicted secreted hydrolase
MDKFLIRLIFVFSIFVCHTAFANLPYFPIQLPRDDAAHDSNVPYSYDKLSEWWYANGKLTTNSGKHFAYFFSVTNFTKPNSKDKHFPPTLNFQLTDMDTNQTYWNLSLYPVADTIISSEFFYLKLRDDLTMWKVDDTYILQGDINLKNDEIKKQHLKVYLRFTPSRKMLLVNENGLVDELDGTNSYYYAFTRAKTEGYFEFGKNTYLLDSTKCTTWFEHQWGDFVINPKHPWLWQHIRLNNGIDILGGSGIDPDSKKVIGSELDIVLPDDRVIYLHNVDDFSLKPMTIGEDHYPSSYLLKVPSLQMKLNIFNTSSGQGNTGIDEAIAHVIGEQQGKYINGYSYSESTVKY